MRAAAAGAPAAPGGRLLLGHPDQHAAEAALPLGALEIAARELLLRLTLLEADHRDVALAREAFDPLSELPADLAEQRRRGDREIAVE